MRCGFEADKNHGGAWNYPSLSYAVLGWIEDAPTKVGHTQREMEVVINRILPCFGKQGKS